MRLEAPRQAVEAPSDVDEITVTGTASNVVDVSDEAQAVTAFSMEDLDKQGIVNVENLAFNVPGLHVGVQGNAVIVTLRGIGTENASPSGEPGVSFMVDGVNYARPVSAQVSFFDLEGVRVTRGPQGTRGGKNATSGWISVISRKPHDDFEMTADLQYGDYNGRRVRSTVNIPINEYLSLRTATFYMDRDGYIDNKLWDDDDRNPFDVDDFGLRQHILMRPTENLESLFTYNYYRQDGNGGQLKLIPRQVADFDTCPPVRATGLPLGVECKTVRNKEFDGIPDPVSGIPGPGFEVFNAHIGETDPSRPSLSDLDDLGSIYTDVGSIADNRFWGFTSTTTYDLPSLPWLGEMQLKGIGSFQKIEASQLQDFDGTELPGAELFVAEETDQASGELQLSSSAGELMDWQLSGFYQRVKADANAEVPFWFERDNAGTSDIGGFPINTRSGYQFGLPGLDCPIPGIACNIFDPVLAGQTSWNKSYGLALHTDWYLGESLSIGAGARYTKDVRELDALRETTGINIPGLTLQDCTGGLIDSDFNGIPDDGRTITSGFPIPDADGNLFVPLGHAECSRTDRHLTGGLNIEWRPLEDQLFYARADRGYKAGGYSFLGFAGAGGYDPEFIWAYAAGAKNTFFEDRLTINTEAFYYDYKDLQVVLVDGVAIRTENAAKAQVWGFDVEAVMEPVPGLRLNTQLGYLNTEFRDYNSIDPVNSEATLEKNKCLLDPATFIDAIEARGETPNCGAAFNRDLRGNSLSRAPEWTVTVGAEYDFYLGDFGSLTPRISYYWQDDTYYRAFNDPLDLQEAYHLTDVKLTWRDANERWLVEAFLNNVENARIYQNVVVGPNVVGSPLNAYYGPPRMWGFRVGYKY